MQRRIRAVTVSLGVLLALAAPAGATVSARLVVDSLTQIEGTTFEVDIVADFTDPVVGFGLDLEIDNANLSVLGLPSLGPSWNPVMAPDGDGLAGIAFPSGIESQNDVLLATVTLSADASGTSVLSLGVTASDLTEGFPLDPDFMDGFDGFVFDAPLQIEILPVPEPSTAVLLAFGALGLAWHRRRATLESRS